MKYYIPMMAALRYVTNQGKMLTTSDGYPVLDEYDMEIIFDYDLDLSKLNVSEDGN